MQLRPHGGKVLDLKFVFPNDRVSRHHEARVGVAGLWAKVFRFSFNMDNVHRRRQHHSVDSTSVRDILVEALNVLLDQRYILGMNNLD